VRAATPGGLRIRRPSPVAFCATLANANYSGRRQITRLVVLPDYQGMWIGLRLLDAVASIETSPPDPKLISITTSHPALIGVLSAGGRGGQWQTLSFTRFGRAQGGLAYATSSGSEGRATASFQYRPVAGLAPKCGSGRRSDR